MNDLIFVALSTFAAEDKKPLVRLKSSGYPFRIHNTGKRITTDELLCNVTDASVILAGVEPYDSATLAQLPALRCISRCGAGVDSIDLDYAKQRGITVTNTPGIPTLAVAELALAMFLSLSRNLYQQVDLMHKRKWKRIEAHLLARRTVGLIGLGNIGQRVAYLCKAFDAFVLACDPITDISVARGLGVELVSMSDLLCNSDIISIHASSSPQNKVIIGKDEIALMKHGAILVNLARGEMVDEDALLEALQEGRLSGAGLDVYGTEPYMGPLCDFKQVIMTPHSATLTTETRAAMEMQCVDNALDFLSGSLAKERRVI